jgi:hypothetical protein
MEPYILNRRQAMIGLAAGVLVAPGLVSADATPKAPAADPADVAAVTAVGGKVTEAGGVVTKLEFRDCSKLGEADFARIGRLKSLKSLTLYGKCSGLNDTTLPLLAGLTALEEIGTDGTQISDTGLKHFTALASLKSASFFHPSLGMKGYTGAGFVHFKALARLQRLTIAGTPFNDDGMAAVAQIDQLQSFRTWHTYQTPSGTAALAKLPNLRDLRFGQRLRRYDGKSNALTLDDAAIGDLAKIASLESLLLDEAKLSYASLVKLKSLAKLQSLALENILIEPGDIEKLQADLPRVKVTIKPVDAAGREKLEKALKV